MNDLSHDCKVLPKGLWTLSLYSTHNLPWEQIEVTCLLQIIEVRVLASETLAS